MRLKFCIIYHALNSGCFEAFLMKNTPRTLGVKVDKNPTWCGSWMLLDAFFWCKKGSASLPLKNVITTFMTGNWQIIDTYFVLLKVVFKKP